MTARKNTVPARDLIVSALSSAEGLSVEALAGRVFRSPETVVNNLTRLKRAGLIERVITYRLKKGDGA
jgi:DNA-binding MarR family transcriptional regulator